MGESLAAINNYHDAAKQGDEDLVVQALDVGYGLPSYVLVDSKDLKGNTAVFWAARRGHTPVVELLIARLCNVNGKNSDLQSAASLACMEGHLGVVKLIHKNKASFRHTDVKGNSCLLLAAFYDHLPVCQFLLSVGEDLLAYNDDDFTVLSYYGMGCEARLSYTTTLSREEKLLAAWASGAHPSQVKRRRDELWQRRGPLLWVLAEHAFRPLRHHALAIAAAAEAAYMPVVQYSPMGDVFRDDLGVFRYFIDFL